MLSNKENVTVQKEIKFNQDKWHHYKASTRVWTYEM